jgi:hypothetical protein
MLAVACSPAKEKVVEPFSFTKSTLPVIQESDGTREKILQNAFGKEKRTGVSSTEGQSCFYEVIEKSGQGSSKYSLKVSWTGKENMVQEFDGSFIKDSGNRIISQKGELSNRSLVRQEIEYSNDFEILTLRYILNEIEVGECEFREAKLAEVPDNFDSSGAWREIFDSDQGTTGLFCGLNPKGQKCGEFSCRVWVKLTFTNSPKLNGFYCTTNPEFDLHEEGAVTTECKTWNFFDNVYDSQGGYVCKEI